MKIGIVGCGLNSDYHVRFAKSYPEAEIIGLVDRDEARAKAAAEKYDIKKTFPSIKELVAAGRPDVIHILTPPKTHYLLTKEAVESGCHVLVEKPLALDMQEARSLYDLAERQGVMLCAMHNHFFDPWMQKADELIRSGQLGEVIHVESHYGLNTRIPAFRDYPSPNVLPWLYDLPGGVFHDFMPHPLYVLLEYTGKPRRVTAIERACGVLPHGLSDELRLIVEGERALGTMTFSFAAQPHLHFVRIHGTKMVIEVDFNTMITVVHPKSPLPKAAQKVIYNLSDGWQRCRSTVSNVFHFLSGKLKPYQGMEVLIHRFYAAIEQKQPAPVSREQALTVVETMDEIWKQITIKPFDFTNILPERPLSPAKHPEKVLVTGGTGFLGKRLAELLVSEGYLVRVLARKLSDIGPLKNLGVEIYWGDVADMRSLEEAFQGVQVVVHAAAGTSGKKQDCDRGTIQGTSNVLALCKQYVIRKLIYISSCGVYGVADCRTGQIMTEEAPLERFPERRGDYSSSKQRAEELVLEAMKSQQFPVVILRPGTIFGPGGELYTPMFGFSAGNLFIVIGNGKFQLPFTYIDNLIDVICRSIESEAANNQVFNVVDSDRINKREYMEKVIKVLYPRSKIFYFPNSLFYLVVWTQEILFSLLKWNPVLTRYRLVSSQKSIVYDNTKIVETLNWQPKVSMSEAIEQIVQSRKV